MGSMSIWHWVIVAVIVMLLFGRGKVSDLMGDVAKGIKAFKKGMAEDETPPVSQAAPPPRWRSSTPQATDSTFRKPGSASPRPSPPPDLGPLRPSTAAFHRPWHRLCLCSGGAIPRFAPKSSTGRGVALPLLRGARRRLPWAA